MCLDTPAKFKEPENKAFQVQYLPFQLGSLLQFPCSTTQLLSSLKSRTIGFPQAMEIPRFKKETLIYQIVGDSS